MFLRILLNIFLFSFCLYLAETTQIVFPLSSKWTLKNDTSNLTVKGHVPGGVYTDLLKAGRIQDPYFRYRDTEYKWIGRQNWTYSTSFSVPKDFPKKKRTNLVFHGLDSVSTIYLNGKPIGNSSNMFVRYVFDVSSILLPNSTNNLTVSFQSPVTYAYQQKEQYEDTYGYNVPPDCPPEAWNGECAVNFVRKMQSSFSWDWAPSFPSQGIWKPVALEAFDSTILRDVAANTFPSYGNYSREWAIEVKAHFEGISPRTALNGTLSILLDKSLVLFNKSIRLDFNELNESSFAVNVSVPKNFPVELWWPNGYGEQKLYNLTVNFTSYGSNETTSKSVRFGFRTIRLVQEDMENGPGATFFFLVNDLPLFAKGSNWVPADSFQERITPAHLRNLLTSAREANINMMRVWGGGVYESDDFYALTDELGILIWQDLMFACALYPTDDRFMESVRTEARQQVRRLQHHPSIAIWAGNNENELGVIHWWSKDDQKRSERDYIELYVKTLLPIVKEEDGSRPYVSSSPSNGKETEKEGWISDNTGSLIYGDVHWYKYYEDSWNPDIFDIPRFASEYGLQSLSSFELLQNVSLPEDWQNYPFSQFLNKRNHFIGGMTTMCSLIIRHLDLPKPGCKPSNESFKDFIYLTQISQAMAIKAETEHFRRWKNRLHGNKGYTMGALYWQLNDIWPTASWASLEYDGHWKMLHYYAREFFAPILVSPYLNTSSDVFNVWLISDDLMFHNNLVLTIAVQHWSSFDSHIVSVSNITLPPLGSLLAFEKDLTDLLKASSCPSPNHCVILTWLNTSTGRPLSYPNFLLLGPLFKAVGLSKANINVTKVIPLSSQKGHSYSIELSTDAVAPFVWLEAKGQRSRGHFDRNGFLLAQPKMNVTYFSQDTIPNLESLLTVHTLRDVCTDRNQKCHFD